MDGKMRLPARVQTIHDEIAAVEVALALRSEGLEASAPILAEQIMDLVSAIAEARYDWALQISEAEPRFRVSVDWENCADVWWSAARASAEAPASFSQFAQADEIQLNEQDLARFLDWAESLPGWASGPVFAPNPLIVDELEEGE